MHKIACKHHFSDIKIEKELVLTRNYYQWIKQSSIDLLLGEQILIP